MSDQVLTLLKFGLLALLYLFFARTLWAVWSEVRATGQVGSPVRQDASRNRSRGPARSESAPSRSGDQFVQVEDAKPATPPTPARPGSPISMASAETAASGSTDVPTGHLFVVEPATQVGVSWPLGRELTIGRAPGCGVLIDDTFASQLHARVWAAGGTWMVEDLGSTNGTVFNGDALTEPRVMKMGDQIRLGSTVLELR